jgi:hypothetical protein
MYIIKTNLTNTIPDKDMERASQKAYISKKEIEIYQRERAKVLQKKQGFSEDA